MYEEMVHVEEEASRVSSYAMIKGLMKKSDKSSTMAPVKTGSNTLSSEIESTGKVQDSIGITQFLIYSVFIVFKHSDTEKLSISLDMIKQLKGGVPPQQPKSKHT